MDRRIAPAIALALGLLAATSAPAESIGTEFSYQGRLEVTGAPANGTYDFEFRLFDEAANGNQIGDPYLVENRQVNDGLFSVLLDFNDVFDGETRYLAIAVRPGDSSDAHTALSGRVRLLSVPYAMHAIDSGLLNGLDSTAFATSGHTHSILYGPANSAYVSTTIVSTDQLGAVNVLSIVKTPDDVLPQELRLEGGNSTGSAGEAGGDVVVIGGRGSDSSPGGKGGNVYITGGLADGSGAVVGSDIVIQPGEGSDGGQDGETLLNGTTIAQDLTPRILRDNNGGMGTQGDVLTADGSGDFYWEQPRVSSIAASDGDPNPAVEADQDGALIFTNGQVLTSFPTQMRLEHNGNALRVNTTSDTDLGILGGSSSIGAGVFRIEATSPAGLGNSGTALTLKAGGGFQNGGNANLMAGDGGQGNGGTLALTAGSVTSVGAAGTGGAVTIVAGNAYQGGGGDVTIEAGDSLFATGAPTPGGDVFLNPGAGVSGGANGKVYANGALVANNAGSSSITLDATVPANPRLTFVATTATGKFSVVAPDAPTSGQDGRDVEILGGSGVNAGTGNGGDITIKSGNGGGIDSGVGGDGGNIAITAGNGNSDSNSKNGGNVVLTAGTAAGAGTAGIVQSNSRVAVLRTSASHPIHVGTSASNGNGAHVTNGGIWTNGSDVNSKMEFEPVDAKDILAKVLALPVTKWQYKGEPEGVRHIGPMAQDFMEAFHLGESERHIGTVDADGVALSAIKGLHQETDGRLKALEAENAELRARLATMEKLVAQLADNKE